jgi:hypothetical protein
MHIVRLLRQIGIPAVGCGLSGEVIIFGIGIEPTLLRQGQDRRNRTVERTSSGPVATDGLLHRIRGQDELTLYRPTNRLLRRLKRPCQFGQPTDLAFIEGPAVGGAPPITAMSSFIAAAASNFIGMVFA